MPRKRISANLRRAASAPVTCVIVYPIFEQDVTQLVGQSTALPHGVPGASDTNDYSFASWVPHCQTMLVWTHVKHGHVDPGRLFDNLQKITQRLHTEMMIFAETRSGSAALRLRTQRFQPPTSSLPGSPGWQDSRSARGNAAALLACRPCSPGSWRVPHTRPAQLPSQSQPVPRPWLPSPRRWTSAQAPSLPDSQRRSGTRLVVKCQLYPRVRAG